MIELITEGASQVSYSNERRVSSESPVDRLARAAVKFADEIDQYLQRCRELGIDAQAARALLEIDPTRERPSTDVLQARWKVRLRIITMAFWHGKVWVREDLYTYLRRGSRLRYQRQVPYHDYLNTAMTLMELGAMMKILRDEEAYPAVRSSSS